MTQPFVHQGLALHWMIENVAGAKERLVASVLEAATAAWATPSPETINRFVHRLGDSVSVQWFDQHGGRDVRVSVSKHIVGPTGIALKPASQLVCVVGSDERGIATGVPAAWAALFTRVYEASVVAVDQTFRALVPRITPGTLASWAIAFPGAVSGWSGSRERLVSLHLDGATLDGSVRAKVVIVENEVERSNEFVTFECSGRSTWSSLEEARQEFAARFTRHGPERVAELFREL